MYKQQRGLIISRAAV